MAAGRRTIYRVEDLTAVSELSEEEALNVIERLMPKERVARQRVFGVLLRQLTAQEED